MSAVNTFREILFPLSTGSFFGEYFEKTPLIVKRNNPAYYQGLPSMEAVLELLVNASSLTSYNVIVEDGKGELNTDLYMQHKAQTPTIYLKQGIRTEAILQLLAEGSVNIAFKSLGGRFATLDKLERTVASELDCTCESVLYLSPSIGVASFPRYDSSDIFVLPITGTRKWSVYQGPVTLPLSTQAHVNFQLNELALVSEDIVQPGDMLYIPRGFVYEHAPQNELSAFIILRTTYMLQLRWILDMLKEIGITTNYLRKGVFPNDINDNQALHKAIYSLSVALDEKMNHHTAEKAFAVRKPRQQTVTTYDPKTLLGALEQLAAHNSLTN